MLPLGILCDNVCEDETDDFLLYFLCMVPQLRICSLPEKKCLDFCEFRTYVCMYMIAPLEKYVDQAQCGKGGIFQPLRFYVQARNFDSYF